MGEPLSDPVVVDLPAPSPGEQPSPPIAARLEFTGSGAEYFRIWVVNLLLTIATLGVYSAWAKVRKARYFWQNTRLDGFAFDYRGRPLAVLRGRALGLLLLGLYTLGPDLGRRTAVLSVAILAVLAPWVFLKAQRFKLSSTTWRGLRFGFRATMRQAYACLAPVLVIWCVLAVATAFQNGPALAIASVVGIVCLPWFHHRLKAFQHAHAAYGDRGFAFERRLGGFYKAYLVTFGLAIVGLVLPGLLVVVAVSVQGDGAAFFASWKFAVLGYGSSLLSYVVLTPYLSARVQQLVWSGTRCGEVCFRTEIRAFPLFKLILKNVALTLATLGLYWPIAAVALARYRIECMSVVSDAPLRATVVTVRGDEPSAAGDAAVDLFGLDIGL